MKPYYSSSSCPQVLRQLLSFDYPKLSLVKCDDDDNEGSIRTSPSLRRGGVSNKCHTEKTISEYPCVICTQCQDNDDRLIFSSEGYHRPILASLLGGGSSGGGSDEDDGWSLCPFCLCVVRRLTGLMDEVEDIKTRIKAIIKLAKTTEGSTFVDKPKGLNAVTHVHVATSFTTVPLPFSSNQHVGDDDHSPMDDVHDGPMTDLDEYDDGEDKHTVSEPMTCFKQEAMSDDDGNNNGRYEGENNVVVVGRAPFEGPFSKPLAVPQAEIDEEHPEDKSGMHEVLECKTLFTFSSSHRSSSLSTGDPTPQMRVLRNHSLRMQKEERKVSGSNIPSLLNNSDQGTTFGNKAKIVRNLQRVRSRPLKDHVYTCPLCPNKTFTTPKKYKRHRKRVHNKRPSPPCYFCQKTLSCPENLVNHLRIHTLERPYLCSNCGQDFTASVALMQHECPKNQCVYPPKPRWQCHLCGKTFKDSTGLGRHTRQAHQATKLDFQPTAGVSGYRCPECGKSFTQKKSLTKHLQGVHLLDPSKKQYCPICPIRFNTEHVFLAHTHPDPKDASNVLYICSICRKTFKTRGNYQHHWTTVHDHRMRGKCGQCEHCGKFFQSAAHMKYHKKSCSVPPKEQRTCPVASCGRVFATFFERLNHERVFHKGLPSTQCYFCSKTFRFTATLEQHFRIHSQERPFRCLKCGKEFPMQDVLKTHMARVCGGDESKKEEARKRKREHQRAFRAKLRYPCHLCDKRFGQKPQLVGHKKRDHET